MSFRTNEPIEVQFEDGGADGVRYHVGPYQSIFYPNRDQSAKAAASRFPKLTVAGRSLADIVPAVANVEPAPAPMSPMTEAEIALGEQGRACAVVEKKKRKSGKTAKVEGPTPELW